MNVPARLAVGACLASHLVRSVLSPDIASTFALELQSFRAEVSEAKLALSRSTLILEHCQSQTGFLYLGLKFLALTEILLLVWLAWLLWDKRRAVGTDQLVPICDSVRELDSPDIPSRNPPEVAVLDSSPTAVGRVGPVRPSDLKKKGF